MGGPASFSSKRNRFTVFECEGLHVGHSDSRCNHSMLVHSSTEKMSVIRMAIFHG